MMASDEVITAALSSAANRTVCRYNWGEQAQPIVYNGVMYVTNAKAMVAIDVGTGKQIWKQTLDWPPETPRVVCCGISNKGAAIYNGKIFRTTLDAHVIAYDAKDGKELWKAKAAEWKEGYSLTAWIMISYRLKELKSHD